MTREEKIILFVIVFTFLSGLTIRDYCKSTGKGTSSCPTQSCPVGLYQIEMQESEKERIDLNSASIEQLCKLPGIDENIAKEIIAFREANKFDSIEQLLSIKGLTKRKILRLTNKIQVKNDE